MLNSGDVVIADLGPPGGREAGFRRPVVVVTARPTLAEGPSVVQVVPLTTRLRGFLTEVEIEPDGRNGLSELSAAQCQHLRSISVDRLTGATGNVGSPALMSIRETLADLLDL